MDEATDLSTVKQLGIVVQYLNRQLAIPKTQFLKLLEFSDSAHATAEVVVSAITSSHEMTASLSHALVKMVGAACDGASVMFGC